MVSTYSEAGVDIDASERATEALIAQIKGVNRKGDGEAIKLDNGFAGLVKLGDGALAMCTDGVGSKILLAEEMNSIHTVGIVEQFSYSTWSYCFHSIYFIFDMGDFCISSTRKIWKK